MNYQTVLEFWFEQLTPTERFKKDEMLDLKMVEKFIAIHAQAISGELYQWRDDPYGRLAEIIIIDQFSRNIYRDDAKAYNSDSMSLVLAQEAIYGNHHKSFEDVHKTFLYMPFMHSESKIIHEVALKLFSEPGLEESLVYEVERKKIIDQFGRFPERNKILGRINTPEEEIYLFNKGSSDSKSKQATPPTDASSLH